MNKRFPSLILFVLLMLSIYVPAAVAHNEPFPAGYDQTHVVLDTIGEPETLDPAWSYDTSSGTIIMNVYDRVLFFDRDYTAGPYETGEMDVFIPSLATDMSIEPGPDPYVKTFYFKIRGTGPTETLTTTSSPVALFKDGAIRAGTLHVRDPDYAKVGMNVGPIRPPTETPTTDGLVDMAEVPGNQYTGVGDIVGTTWQGPDFDFLITSYIDLTGPAGLSASDIIDAVRVCSNGLIYWNVRVWLHVVSVDSTDPYTITVEPVPVYFCDGVSPLTPGDVEYSWERWMVQDRSGGPLWMFVFPVLGEYYALSPAEDPNFGDKIDDAIGSNSTHAWVSLRTDFPETTFLQIIAQSWASIVNKDWCVNLGDFDGNWAAGWETIYDTWHDPDISFIEDQMMGTGPYMLDYWVHGTAYSIIKSDHYWGGWPHYDSDTGTERLPGYISRVTLNLMVSWTTRRARFLAGDADYTYVPTQYRDQCLNQVVGGEPVRCFYPVVPNIACGANFYTFDISTASPYLGPGFDPGNPNTIAEDRIPVDLFDDINVRRGFNAAFNSPLYIDSAFLGEAETPTDPVVPGLSYDNVEAMGPVYDMVKAENYLKLAWGGSDPNNDGIVEPGDEGALWTTGMTFEVLYNEGNVARQTAAQMMSDSVNSLNAKFHLTTRPVSWGSTYLPQMIAGMLPNFIIGWLQDYPDADNFAFPFMHTYGTFSQWQGYSNPRVDELIEYAALMPDDTAAYNDELDVADPRPLFNNPGGLPPDTRWPRRSSYYELQALYVDDAPGMALYQVRGRSWQQAWNRGYYYNPILPGVFWAHRWKALTHFGDANNDGSVGLLDAATISASWTKPHPASPIGPKGHLSCADINGGTGGTTGSESGTVIGIPDGKVSVADAALVSAYWDGPPQGPLHP